MSSHLCGRCGLARADSRDPCPQCNPERCVSCGGEIRFGHAQGFAPDGRGLHIGCSDQISRVLRGGLEPAARLALFFLRERNDPKMAQDTLERALSK